MLLGREVHFRNSEYAAQLFSGYFHRAWRWRRTGCRLRKCSGHGRVKGHIALHLLHDLMNMTVKDRYGAESFHHGKGLFAIRRTPAPSRVDCPQRNVGKEDDGGTILEPGEIRLEPCKLGLTKFPHAFQFDHVNEADKMHAVLVEAVPSVPHSAFAVAFQIEFSVIHGSIVFPRNIEDLPLCAGQNLAHS